jgi:DNA-binding MarR family transcriptional regulator
MIEPATQQTQDAWKGILFAHAQVVRALEADLAAHSDLPLTWFDIMNRLNEHPDHQLRVHELADASLFTRSGLTRLVDRIEQAGYVCRQHSAHDRRGVYIVLTQAGRDKLQSIWPHFTISVQQHFGQHLTPADTKTIIAATNKILDTTPGPDNT